MLRSSRYKVQKSNNMLISEKKTDQLNSPYYKK